VQAITANSTEMAYRLLLFERQWRNGK